MRKSLAVGLWFGLLGTALLAKAQEEPSKFDLYGGYYYARINVNANVPGIAPAATYIGKGGGGQLEYNAKKWLGVVGDLSGFYATSAGKRRICRSILNVSCWAPSEFQARKIYAVRSSPLRRPAHNRWHCPINRDRR